MNWKVFMTGVAAGAAAGHLINYYLLEPKTISGDVILENVKEAFKKEGPIEGSWIQLKKQHYKKIRDGYVRVSRRHHSHSRWREETIRIYRRRDDRDGYRRLLNLIEIRNCRPIARLQFFYLIKLSTRF
ncbi:hypothetical protein PCORN_09997 [Listeria cornellensis FSL F6-0969]|uniref:Uncharacterized protein n=1 Tax=Listeria cornellensis FSL F6-0969 TaxID=1265820 RepID=W7BXS8_9LIST|nr:hypothetical protein PCORN_09997 [Listeria cornellensis FSL F6-0969]